MEYKTHQVPVSNQGWKADPAAGKLLQTLVPDFFFKKKHVNLSLLPCSMHERGEG
jgi:hypothetical protein